MGDAKVLQINDCRLREREEKEVLPLRNEVLVSISGPRIVNKHKPKTMVLICFMCLFSSKVNAARRGCPEQ